MKLLFSVLLLLGAIPSFSMNRTAKNSHGDESVARVSDNAYCPYGQWGSSEAEPIDAIIPASWGRSAISNPQNENEKLQEAIKHMQERKIKSQLQDQEDCCDHCIKKVPLTAKFTCLSALIYFCFFYENKQP